MIDTSGRAAALWALIVTASFAAAIPAFSQQPTDAQRSAIRAQCRADYEAHCASVPPGGMASLQCLQKNMSSLAPGCQSAVRAVEAPAEPKADVNKADVNKADTDKHRYRSGRTPRQSRPPRRRRHRLRRPPRPHRPRSRALRRLPRSAVPVAPTTRGPAPASRRAARRRSIASSRTRRGFRRAASRPSPRPAAARRPRQAAPPRRPPLLPQRRRRRWRCGRCVRARSCSCCGRHVAAMSARFAAG